MYDRRLFSLSMRHFHLPSPLPIRKRLRYPQYRIHLRDQKQTRYPKKLKKY